MDESSFIFLFFESLIYENKRQIWGYEKLEKVICLPILSEEFTWETILCKLKLNIIKIMIQTGSLSDTKMYLELSHGTRMKTLDFHLTVAAIPKHYQGSDP